MSLKSRISKLESLNKKREMVWPETFAGWTKFFTISVNSSNEKLAAEKFSEWLNKDHPRFAVPEFGDYGSSYVESGVG